MQHDNSLTGLSKHGFGVEAVKAWREREHDAGRPSGLEDFYRAHALCAECGGSGRKISGARWRDPSGVQHTALLGTEDVATIGDLFDRHLRGVGEWEYVYERCAACGGTGKTKPTGAEKDKGQV